MKHPGARFRFAFSAFFSIALLLVSGCTRRAGDEFSRLTNLGRTYYEKGEAEKAVAPFEQALRLNPGHPDARLNPVANTAGATDTAIVRIEQLYPFPEAEFAQELMRYPAASAVVWAQEEPRNMGAWGFVRGHIQPLLEAQRREIGYAGRPESASPAPGSPKRHVQEQAELIEQSFAPATVARRWRKRLVRRLKPR